MYAKTHFRSAGECGSENRSEFFGAFGAIEWDVLWHVDSSFSGPVQTDRFIILGRVYIKQNPKVVFTGKWRHISSDA